MERVAVIGAGSMGAGIAEVCARVGSEVLVLEVSDEAIAAGQKRLQASLEWGIRTGKVAEDHRDLVTRRVLFTTAIGDLADRELVIESVTERLDLKTRLFTEIDNVLKSESAVIATNTSSIPIIKLARATNRPDRVIGLHFFNPVPIQPLVELVPSLLTSADTLDRCRSYALTMGKRAIHSKDRSGFVVNVLLVPYLLSAIRLVEAGFASAEDIDLGMVLGAAHRVGPLAVADFIGVDTLLDVANVLYEEFKDPAYAPPPLLSRMVDAGLHGRKSGKGFYEYPSEHA